MRWDCKDYTRFVKDEWPPNRPDGKKQYDAEFLLKLRHFPASLLKPDYNIPVNMSLDKRNSSISKHDGSQSKIESTNSDKSGKPPRKVSIPLRETENPLKPTRSVVTDENFTEEDKIISKKLYKKVRSILNKLTSQNVDTVVKQIADLNIDTPDRLKGVIDIIFEKAMDEPDLSVSYAELCKKIQDIKESAVDWDEDKPHSFNLPLISQGQIVFEKQFLGETDERKKKFKKVAEVEACTDPEKRKKLSINLEECELRIRTRSIALIHFIGELFKQNMLTAEIMLRCLRTLLANGDDECLECLCKLLIEIGEKLDQQRHAALNEIFEELKRIPDTKPNVNSGTQYMMWDVTKLRDRHWIKIYQCGHCGDIISDAYTTHGCFILYDDTQYDLICDESRVVYLEKKNVNKNRTAETNAVDESIDDELLISLVAIREPLYDLNLPLEQRTESTKADLWKEISNNLNGMNIDKIKGRWKYLRDSFIHAHEKVKEYLPSGSGACSNNKPDPEFKYYEMMQFLSDKNESEEAHYSSAKIPTTSAVYTVGQTSSSSSSSSSASNQNVFSSVSEKTSNRNSRRNRKKKKNDEEMQFKNAMPKVVPEPTATPATPLEKKPATDGLEGYLSCLGEALEKLPYRKRAQLEIKFLQMALDASDE